MQDTHMYTTVLGCLVSAVLNLALHVQAEGTKISVRFADESGFIVETEEYDSGCKIFSVSDYLKAGAESSRKVVVECKPRIFAVAVGVLEGLFAEGSICLDDIAGVLCLAEHLEVTSEHWKNVFYTSLAKVTVNNESFRKRMEMHRSVAGFGVYMLQLLRSHVSACGLDVMVRGTRATLCLKSKYEWNGYGSREAVDAVKEVGIQGDAMRRMRAEGQDKLHLLKWFFSVMDIHWLDVSHCTLSADVMECIAGMACLRRLSVAHCRVGAEHLERLKSLNLVNLDVSKNRLAHTKFFFGLLRSRLLGFLAQSGLSIIGELRSLKRLNLANCGLRSGSLSRIENLDLVDLNVSGNRLGESDMQVIGKMGGLTRLIARDCSLRPESLVHLQELEQLDELDVSMNALSAKDMQVIGSMRSLVKLVMACCKTDSSNLEHLQGLAALRELSISVSSAFLDRSCLQAVSKISGLERLRICDFGAGSEGIECLKDLRNLEDLEFSKTKLSAVDTLGIGATQSLRYLHLAFTEMDPGSLRQLQSLQHLKDLKISSKSKLSRDDILCIKEIRSLISLCIAMCELEDGCLEGLQEMGSLRNLCIIKTKLSSSNAQPIGNMKNLQGLSIQDCSVSAEDLQYLYERVPLCAFN